MKTSQHAEFLVLPASSLLKALIVISLSSLLQMHSDSNCGTASVCIINNCGTNIDTLGIVLVPSYCDVSWIFISARA